MKTGIKTLQVIKKGILATFLWIGTILGILFVVTFFAIQVPYIQTRIVNTLTDYLSEKTDHEISVGSVNISWFDSLILGDIQVIDTFDSTMLSSNSVYVDFSLFDLLLEEDMLLDAVQIENGILFMQKRNDTTALNITHFFRKLRSNSKSNTGEKKRKDIRISRIKIENAQVAINDFRKPPSNTPWDYNHIVYTNVDCSISDFTIAGDTIRASIDQLNAVDQQRSLDIESMSSQFVFTSKHLLLNDLELQTNNSIVKNSIEFIYTDPSNMSFFVDSVTMELNFDQSVIHSKDIQLFSPAEFPFQDSFKLSGMLSGKVGRLEWKQMQLMIGKSSYVNGYLSLNGLPNVTETFIDLNINQSKLYSEDIKPLVPIASHTYLDSLGSIQAKASFLGFYSDFVAKGYFSSDLGTVDSNLNLKLPQNSFNGQYSGRLDINDFKLGNLIQESSIDVLSLNGQINGSGFNGENADFFLNAHIDEIGYNGYRYSDIETDAEFASQFFEGKLNINDPNLKFQLEGTVDLRNNQNKVNFAGALDTLNLKALNLSQRDIFLSTKLDLDFVGLELDSIIGFADFQDFYFRNEDRNIAIDTISIVSTNNFQNRDLTIQTERVSFNASGNYSYNVFFEDIKRGWQEYNLIFRNEKDSIENYFENKKDQVRSNYKVNLSLSISDADPYIKLFTDKIKVGRDTEIKGTYSQSETSILKFNSHLDTLIYDRMAFYNNDFDFNSSKLSDSTAVLAMLYISSEKQLLNQSTSFDNLFLEAIWAGNNIAFSSNVQQTDADNKARLYGDFQFLEDKYRLNFKPSELVAIGREWNFSRQNEVIFDDGKIYFNNFEIHHNNQVLSLGGVSSTDSKDVLSLEIKNFELDNLNPIINSKLEGVLNTKADITGKGDELLVESDLSVTSLTLNDFLIGDVIGTSNWENAYDRLRIGFEVDRLNRKVIQLGGYFYPKEVNQLDIVANFNQTSLKVAEPFISKNFKQIDGNLTGQFTISGAIKTPVLEGRGTINEGELTVNYLNTHYEFAGDVIFKENEIGVRELTINDVNNNKAVANGGVLHDGFKNFILNVEANMRNFQVVNTTSSDNDLYYGTANLTGNVRFDGPLYNLQISAKATTNRGTRIFIPVKDNTSISQEDFIKFVTPEDSENKEVQETITNSSKVDLRGIKLDFDLDITPDAYTELIFDIKSGDIIRGRGNGKINLQINTDGDFLMFGDFVIVNGGYNFTLKNIINKEFDLIDGSKISWYGDPYQGGNGHYSRISAVNFIITIIRPNSRSRPY